MNLQEFYQTYSSDCTAGSANQLLARLEKPIVRTGRNYYRLSHGGENYSLLFSNTIDSTFADGSISRANDVGGRWVIHQMRVGLCAASGEEPAVWHIVTFAGETEKMVEGPGAFCTDPIPLQAKAGDVLCYEICFEGACFPYHEEIVLPVTVWNGEEFELNKQIPVPLMIGSDRPVEARYGFIGDSITQGCGTPVDSYEHWVARIAEELPESYSVWDLGIGYARAYDAATDGDWLGRAKTCDTVHVCFGVNDILKGRTAEQVIEDLRTIVLSLKTAGRRVILFTVPPYDMMEEKKEYWYTVNAAIRGEIGALADAVFDFAKALGQEAPNEHCSIYGGHPNSQGCAVAARRYLEERAKGSL